LAPKPKNSRQSLQPLDSNRRPRSFPNSNQEAQAHTEGEAEQRNPSQRFAMIKGWNSKHLWKHVCKQPARETHLRKPRVRHKVKMIGLNATKSSNLSSHVGCAVFETRIVSIQRRTQVPWMGVLCGLRLKTRNQHSIVSWTRRRNPTGPGYQRTEIDGSLQTRKIRNLHNPVRIWPYGVLGVKRFFGNGICTSTSSKTTPIS